MLNNRASVFEKFTIRSGAIELRAVFVKTALYGVLGCPSGNYSWVKSWPSRLLSVSEADYHGLHKDLDDSLRADTESLTKLSKGKKQETGKCASHDVG